MEAKASSQQNPVSFLLLTGKIKRALRTGWQLKGVPNVESVSDHMYRMALMAFLLPAGGQVAVDRERVMKMALVHDLAECLTGDITPHCGVSKEEKLRRETEAMTQICRELDGDTTEEVMALWNEYNAQATPEARMTKDFDRFEMILQAFEYEEETQRPKWLQDFFDSTSGKFGSTLVAGWAEELCRRRDEKSSSDAASQ